MVVVVVVQEEEEEEEELTPPLYPAVPPAPSTEETLKSKPSLEPGRMLSTLKTEKGC